MSPPVVAVSASTKFGAGGASTAGAPPGYAIDGWGVGALGPLAAAVWREGAAERSGLPVAAGGVAEAGAAGAAAGTRAAGASRDAEGAAADIGDAIALFADDKEVAGIGLRVAARSE